MEDLFTNDEIDNSNYKLIYYTIYSTDNFCDFLKDNYLKNPKFARFIKIKSIYNTNNNQVDLKSYALIKNKDKFIGALNMNILSFRRKSKNIIKIQLELIISPFYDNFNEQDLKWLLNYLHLDHSKNLKIPKISPGYKFSINLNFSKKLKLDEKWDRQFVKKYFKKINKTICNEFFREYNSNTDPYDLEKYFILKMDSFEEWLIPKSLKDKKFINAILIYPYLDIDIYLALSPKGYSRIKLLISAYLEFFYKNSISKIEFVEIFYSDYCWDRKDIKHSKSEDSIEYKKVIEFLTWTNDYLHNDMERVLNLLNNSEKDKK